MISYNSKQTVSFWPIKSDWKISISVGKKSKKRCQLLNGVCVWFLRFVSLSFQDNTVRPSIPKQVAIHWNREGECTYCQHWILRAFRIRHQLEQGHWVVSIKFRQFYSSCQSKLLGGRLEADDPQRRILTSDPRISCCLNGNHASLKDGSKFIITQELYWDPSGNRLCVLVHRKFMDMLQYSAKYPLVEIPFFLSWLMLCSVVAIPGMTRTFKGLWLWILCWMLLTKSSRNPSPPPTSVVID